MNIQTLSIVVPTKGCVNKCKFCVSHMHENNYVENFDKFQMSKRLKWALLNNVNTCIITGTGEPFQNIKFLSNLAVLFREMDHPFPNVEFQTSGVMLLNNKDSINGKTGKLEISYPNIELLKKLGVNTISLSVSDLFDYENNLNIIGVPDKLRFSLTEVCNNIKAAGFNLRISLNMINIYDYKSINRILKYAKYLNADQITFRKMYYANDNSDESIWVQENSTDHNTLDFYKDIIKTQGTALYNLPFGATVYSVNEMSIVVDDNCMNKDSLDTLKYVIIREDGKLYSQWDDKGSLIF